MHSSKREYCMQYSQPLIMNVDHQCRKQSLLHQIYWNILGSKPCVDSEDQGLKLATGSFTMGFSSERGLLKKKKKILWSNLHCIIRSDNKMFRFYTVCQIRGGSSVLSCLSSTCICVLKTPLSVVCKFQLFLRYLLIWFLLFIVV